MPNVSSKLCRLPWALCLLGAALILPAGAAGQQSHVESPPRGDDANAAPAPDSQAAPAPDADVPADAAESPAVDQPDDASEEQEDAEVVSVSKPTRWHLAVSNGAAGKVHQIENGATVEVTAPGNASFNMQLQISDFKIQQGRWYTLTFEARANRPRRFSYILSMVHPPWHSLGFAENGEVGTEWKAFRGEFVASKSEDQAGFLFPIGGSTTGIEVRNVALTERIKGDARSDRWRLETTRHSRARLEFPEDQPDAIRIEVEKKGRTSWNIKAITNTMPVQIYRRYAVSFRARADEDERPIAAYISQSYAPYKTLGMYEELSLTDEWDDYRFEFSSTGNDENVRLAFMVGNSTVPVEFADVQVEAIEQQAATGPLPPPDRKYAWMIVAAFWALIAVILLYKRQRVRDWLADIQQGQLAAMEERRARQEARTRRSLSRRRG